LGNLRKVTQGEQTRWFAYDSLSRLIRAKNPEQENNGSLPPHTDPVTGGSGWAIAYSYDANGNLFSKTDARNITTYYAYDALNRNTTVDYSDTTDLNPDITHVYDNNNPDAYGKGRLWLSYARGDFANGTDTDLTAIDGYDALGRPLSVRQHFKVNGVWKPGVSVGYTASVTYDLAGNVKTMTYPSGRTVNYGYDGAGRLGSFTGRLGDGQLRTYSTITQYHPAGMIERETFGTQTPLYQKKRYNNRLQLGDLLLSASTEELSYDRGALLFFHGPNAVASNDPLANDPTNNGNLVKQAHYVPITGGGEVVPQADNYTYDALNRISGVVEPNVFTQTYGYDQFGNRRITSATGVVNNYNPTYDTGSNRIVGPSYDKAGNITSDILTGGTMIYDAENRLLRASAGGGGIYTYDANGKRTRRTAGGQETWYVYGVGGELLAEYAANGETSAPQKEYGYRDGQILIIAESVSGGGTSFVKPALKPSTALIGKSGPEADGNVDGPFVAEEPIADLKINEDSGSTPADFSSDNDIGTLVRGGPRTTAEEYGNAPSANGVGGELLAEHPAGAAPSAPQKEYGYRGGPSIATVQSGGVVSVNPTANQSPDPGQGGVGVSVPINTGHDPTTSSASRNRRGFSSQTKTCLWSSFSGVSGTKTRVTLKFDWNLTASVNVSVFEGSFASAIADYEFRIEYSLDNGSTWIRRVGVNDSISMDSPGSDGRSITPFGSESIDLPNPGAIDITQIRVRDYISASANLMNDDDGSATGFAKASVSFIRLEVDTVPDITGVSSSAVTHNSANISWTTNEPADSQVEYGTDQTYGQWTALNPTLVTAHSQALSGLNSDTLYHYRVKSKDATGNLAMSVDFTFRTQDITAPTVTSFFPAAGATNVNANANVTVTFSEAMDAATVNGSTVELRDSSNALAPATISYNAASFTATLDPTASLAAGVTYTARVRGGGTDPRVKDVAGNSLAADVTWTFTISQSASAAIKWLVTDHLGSTRMVIDETGSLAGIKRQDFLPFGEVLSAGVGIRSENNGYSGDSVRQKFDGYERDDETRLDYAQTRYFSSAQGRFTSPDSFFGRKTNPQTLNLYAYVLNNPLKWIDPTGHRAQKKQDPVDDCRCTIDYIDSEHPGEIERKKPGLISRIWGGVKKIGSAIGGGAKEAGSEIARIPHLFVKQVQNYYEDPAIFTQDLNFTLGATGYGSAFGAAGAIGAETGEVTESVTVVEDVLAESDVILYHGTDLASAESILAGEGLSASRAAALKLEVNSPPGFFLATHAEDAAYFATRRGTGAILEFRFSPSAVEALGGLPTSPLGALGKFGRFLGGETVIPAKSFEIFNAIRVSGGITVRPH
jgi:RHS repeat-associated protein